MQHAVGHTDEANGELGRATKRLRGSPPTNRGGPMRRVHEAPNGRRSPGSTLDKVTFDEALRTVLALAQALEGTDPEPAASATASGAVATAAAIDRRGNAHDTLSRALNDLGAGHTTKLAAVLVAGRNGVALSAAAGTVANQTNPPLADLTGLADFLQRGQSIAYATEFPIEQPLAKWTAWDPRNLVERAWLSFGRQLALSRPDDWDCFGMTDAPPSRQLTSLYLRASGRTWWSFRRLLDRPGPRAVEMARTDSAATLLARGSLTWLADARCFTEGRALRRALGAIRARLGACAC